MQSKLNAFKFDSGNFNAYQLISASVHIVMVEVQYHLVSFVCNDIFHVQNLLTGRFCV